MTQTTDGLGKKDSRSTSYFWKTNARAGNNIGSSGYAAQAARATEEAVFADGKYLVHIYAADLVGESADMPDDDEVLVHNFPPHAMSVQASQGGSLCYRGSWSLNPTVTGRILTNTGKWINGRADAVLTIDFSEPMWFETQAPRVKIKDRNGNITVVVLKCPTDANKMTWEGTIARSELLDDNRFDRDGSNANSTIAIQGDDLAEVELDTNPATLGVRTGKNAYTGYEKIRNAAWRVAADLLDPVVDTSQKLKIDTKHDESPESTFED